MNNSTESSNITISNDQPNGLDAFASTTLILILCNIVFHSIGCFLLFRLYRNGKENVQQIYLINLSVTHTLGNVFQLISRILLMAESFEICLYIIVILLTVFTLSYYMSMVYITVDKALDVILNIKYPVYWNQQKAKWLVLITWFCGIISCILVFMLHFVWSITFDSIADFLFLYIYPTFDISFIILAVICYSFLFHKYKESQSIPGSIKSKNSRIVGNGYRKKASTSVIKIFKSSCFYISVLLILTFLAFMVLPNSVYLFYGVLGGNKSAILDEALLILFNCSYLLDAWIYIFAQRSVRRIFFRKFYRNRDRFRSSMSSQRSVLEQSIRLHMRRLGAGLESTETSDLYQESESITP